MGQSLMVTGLDEVMDWPAVWNPDNPSYKRIWAMIEATFAARGVVEGHASGLRDLPSINAFAAAGLASDHEVQTPEETWDKLTRGLFIELRVYAMAEIVAWLLAKGLQDWSQIAFTTDDRSASHTLELGASDHNARVAIEAGLAPEIAIQCLTINPARHMRLTPYVGSLSPGRFGDVVLLSDVGKLAIAEVWADGAQVSEGKRYIGPVPEIKWPEWATRTVNINRTIRPEDFALAAEPGRATMNAAVIRPFHWHPDFYTLELPVRDGAVQRDPERGHHQIRHRRPLLRRGSCLENVLARLWTAHAGHGAGLLGRARQAQYLGRRLLGCSDGEGRQRAGRTAGRLGAGARRRTRRHRPLRGRRLDELPSRRSARCRHAGPLRGGPQGRLDV